MAARRKFETTDVLPHRALAMFYLIVLLGLGALIASFGWHTFIEIQTLGEVRNVLRNPHLLWLILILPLAALSWLHIFPRIALDLITGRPLASLSHDGPRARSVGIRAAFQTVSWQEVTEIGKPRTSGSGTSPWSAFMPSRISIKFKRHAKGGSVIVGGRRKHKEQISTGTLKTPTSYANLNGIEIKDLLERFRDEFGDSDPDSECSTTSTAVPFTSLTDGVQFLQHTVIDTFQKPDADLDHDPRHQ